MSFLLTKEQIDRFNDYGYLIVDNLLDEKTITQLHTRFDRLFRGEFETGIRPDEVNWQEGDSDPELLFANRRRPAVLFFLWVAFHYGYAKRD